MDNIRVQRFESYFGMVAASQTMRQLFEKIELIANSNSTVLIRGESGTGKELVARAIHSRSTRAARPFVAINCTAIPESLYEDELFGHKKGAFTGASENRAGRLEQADRGTLFLDEIGNMRPELQAKLLRVLQEREFHRIGENDSIKVDVRVIAATNVDLEEKVKQNQFREDLYYRLNVISLFLPPLRERREDIPLLAAYFLEKKCASNGRPLKQLDEQAIKALTDFHWPGNVRQLENAVERAVVMSGDRSRLTADDFQELITCGQIVLPSLGSSAQGLDLKTTVHELEKKLILESLSRSKGNKAKAAQMLNMKRSTFVEKLKRFYPLLENPGG